MSDHGRRPDHEHRGLRQREQAVGSTVRNENEQASLLAKVDAILRAFDPDEPELSLADLARRTGFAKTTVHRITAELVELGLLERSERRYHLGIRLFELGQLMPWHRALRDTALPFMQDLLEATHETVNLAVLEGTEVLYAERIMGHRKVSAPIRVASRLPLHCTALGKVLLAFSPPELTARLVSSGLRPRTPYTIVSPTVLLEQLRQIASKGVAFEHEESVVGIGCAASPVFGPGNRLVAALSVSAPVTRADPARMGPAVRTASLALSRALAQSSA
jgi:DNA-binding IclR family transcriptional regulator